MTDLEILAQLKISYENLYDIRENGCEDRCSGQLPPSETSRLITAISNIDSIFESYSTVVDLSIPMDKLEIEDKEDIRDVRIDRDISGGYELVLNNGDSEYITCSDANYRWYEDYELLDKDPEIIYEGYSR